VAADAAEDRATDLQAAGPVTFDVFLSHSVPPEDLPRLAQLRDRMSALGLGLSVPTRGLHPPRCLPLDVRREISGADLVLVIVARGGRMPASVAREIRYALARRRKVLALVEDGVRGPRDLDGIASVRFRRGDSRAAFAPARELVERIRADREFSVMAVGLALQVLDGAPRRSAR